MKDTVQDLSKFKLPEDFRGRPGWYVQLWWVVQAAFFRSSPQILYGFRRVILRMFGAKIGKNVIIRPSVTVTYPWKLVIGDYSWIGDDVVLYSLGDIEIGHHTVISQKCYICAADHDHKKIDFPIRARKVVIGNQAWIAADSFIGPGVTIADKVVIGARSTVFRDIAEASVYVGGRITVRKTTAD